MDPSRHKEAWEELGKLDPLWAILSIPDRKFGKWNLESFYRSGEVEIGKLLEDAARLKCPLRRERVLDFGCGVGRITRPLSGHFEKVFGVDVSESMITQARDQNRERPNCEFLVNNQDRLEMFTSDHFDLIYSNLVLMHLPSRMMIEACLSEFVRTLRSGGLLVFQLPSHVPFWIRNDPRRKLYGVLRRLGIGGRFLYERMGMVPITMRSVPEAEIKSFLAQSGARLLEVKSEHDASSGIDNRLYYVTK